MSQEFTYNQLINVFNTFASQYWQLRSFYAGKPEDYRNPDKVYPLLYVQCNNVESNDNELIYDFEFIVLDRVHSEGKNSNENEVFSDTLQIINDLKGYLTNAREYNFTCNPSAQIQKVGKEIDSDLTSGWLTNLRIRTDWNADICSIPGLLIPYAFESGTSSTPVPNFLTCENLSLCSTFVNALSAKADLSAITNGNSYTFSSSKENDNILISTANTESDNVFNVEILLNDVLDITHVSTDSANIYNYLNVEGIIYSGLTNLYNIFLSGGRDEFINTDNNFQILTGGTANYRIIDFKLKDDVTVKRLNLGMSISGNSITGYLTNSTFDFTNSVFNNLNTVNASNITSTNIIANSISTSGISASHIYSGASLVNINKMFASTSHTHNFSALTSTAHTHSITDVSNLSNLLNTKANTSGNTSFSSTTISAQTVSLSGTNITYLLGNDSSGFRIRGIGANRFHTAARQVIYNSLTVTANRIYLAPFPVPRNINVDTLSYYVSTAVASSAIRLGIYGSDSNNMPFNLVVDAGSATTVSNSQLITFNINTNLTGNNLYWLAFIDDGAVNGFAHAAANSFYADVIGASGNFGVAPTHFYQTATSVASLPTTITSINFGTGSIPMVQFRIT